MTLPPGTTGKPSQNGIRQTSPARVGTRGSADRAPGTRPPSTDDADRENAKAGATGCHRSRRAPGPRFKAQPGVILLARKTGYPIVPVTYSARKIKIFSSWDRFLLPFPFTRCRVIEGQPVRVPMTADRAQQEICRQILEAELCRITRSAGGFFGHRVD